MAYDFNGSSQSLQTASTPITGTPLTLSAWVNVDSSKFHTVFGIGSGVPGNFSSFRIRVNADYKVVAIHANSTASASDGATTTGTVTAGSWNHVLATFTSNTSRAVYLNGTKTNGGTTSVTASGLGIIEIGYITGPIGTGDLQYMDGKMAELAVWDSVLTDDEILSLARGFTPDQIRPQSLQFYAPLVRDLQDRRGGRTITNNNGATVAVHPRIIG